MDPPAMIDSWNLSQIVFTDRVYFTYYYMFYGCDG